MTVVAGQHRGGEMANALSGRRLRELGEQEGGDPATLPAFGHGKRERRSGSSGLISPSGWPSGRAASPLPLEIVLQRKTHAYARAPLPVSGGVGH